MGLSLILLHLITRLTNLEAVQPPADSVVVVRLVDALEKQLVHLAVLMYLDLATTQQLADLAGLTRHVN
ncbi:hypothetical protein PC118_g12418 [Phytophthora cactorum]|uniref:Uncharacterized protein n=1 Tax=Phytophthora cactorum TaxID=29920 RepID=A0A8T1C8N7_9STRA|nr:hypothetical protein PC112_g11935 [Phytophthora cactorum]KAG2825662.1 hypothetical protein PC111_g9279 [Phytophthora cactorum]KAG2856262.1 hypothetical protein PC113_g11728 [Phytophthora cactorum]KAG2892381.1 hypothetical protein PC117_g24023 [Phytophthora cactorum]KAG2914813.1 hypothetical protein PC115_g11571 [Phytophthora cactorum]